MVASNEDISILWQGGDMQNPNHPSQHVFADKVKINFDVSLPQRRRIAGPIVGPLHRPVLLREDGVTPAAASAIANLVACPTPRPAKTGGF